MSTGLFSDEEEEYNLEEEVKYKLKLDTPSEPALPVSDDEDLDFGGIDFDDDENIDSSDDKPFDDEPFDAGVEADEDEDPEKYIQQLAGKLGTTLRKYTENRGEPDFSLEKFAINSVVSATNTADMPDDDRKDIISKINSSGGGNDDIEVDVNINKGDDEGSDGDSGESVSDDEFDVSDDGGLEESSDPKFETGDPNFAPSTPEKGMWETDELSVYDNNSNTPEIKNEMFFNDIFNIHQSVSDLLSACDESVDDLLSDGHAWAVEHITTATVNMQNIHQFLQGNQGVFGENRDKTNYTFFQDLKTLKRITFDILNMYIDVVDELISSHHEWISNLAAKSLTHVVDVYDFMYEYVIGGDEWSKPMEITSDEPVSNELQYHIDNSIPLSECVFRYGSDKYFKLISEVKSLYDKGIVKLNENDKIIVEDFTGEFVNINGKIKLLEFIEEDLSVNQLNESDKYKGKKSSSPSRDSSGGKAYKVYVPGCSAKTDSNPRGIKVIRFGSGGLRAKLSDSDARKRYDSRHGCSKGNHNDKCKAGYWSCRLPRYAKKLGLSGGGKWW